MLKAQLAKHLLNIISDRRLALRLKHDHKVARACGFRRQTPSHGLFTHFRHRLGEETYLRIFNQLTRMLLESGTIIGKVVAVDSTHLKAYSGRAMDNRTGRSDPTPGSDAEEEASSSDTVSTPPAAPTPSCPSPSQWLPVTRTIRCTSSRFWRGCTDSESGSRSVLADSQYSSVNVRDAAEWLGAEPVIPVRRDSRLKDAFRVGRDFVARGAKRIVELFRKRWSIERLFGRAKESANLYGEP